MKQIYVVLIAVGASLLLVPGCTQDNQSDSKLQSSASAEEYYTCPMHPSVRSDRPGACPICGMALVKRSAAAQTTAAELTNLRRVQLSPTQRVLANVSTEAVRSMPLSREITMAGIVDAAEPMKATVAARFRGRIEKLHVDFTGGTVRKGDPLFELYSPDLISAQQEFLLGLQSGGDAVSADTGAPGSMSAGLFQASRNRLKVHFGMTDQQINRLAAEGQLRSTLAFNAPLSGTVLKKDVQEGQYVNEGDVLYLLVDLSTVWVYFDVYEQDLGHVTMGQSIEFTTGAYSGEVFEGRVLFVDPVMNPETRTARVRIEASNPRGRLKTSMFVTGILKAHASRALAVPSGAILSTGHRTVVWVEVESNTFEPRDVVTGESSNGYTQVLSGLREGDLVASSGGYLIDSESQLQQPLSVDPHRGHKGAASPKEENSRDKLDRDSASGNAGETIEIHVGATYVPDVIRVRKGKTVKLSFHRETDSKCTEEVVFEDLGIRERLPAWEKTTVTITPLVSGTFKFTCGMKMVHGTLIVE